jgi:hypothetical protein
VTERFESTKSVRLAVPRTANLAQFTDRCGVVIPGWPERQDSAVQDAGPLNEWPRGWTNQGSCYTLWIH